MLNSETKRHIDAARDVLVGVAPNPTTQIDQITYALIYKFMDDMDQAAIKAGGEPSFFIGDLEPFAWSKLVDSRMGNQEKMNLYGEALVKFSEAKQLPELFRIIFRSAFLPYRSPETLGLFLKEISYFNYSHPEELGNAYEYLLSIMSSQGDAGQFRTPRHIIDFIVDVLNPTKDDKVLDPACGTGGFLVSTYNHILEQHDGKNDPKKKEKTLTPDERKKLMQNLQGYDIDPTMVRIAQVNMYLHQFKNPQIFQYDSLTSEDRWSEKFDVVLANPPFMTPKGGIKPHNKFGISSNRSEVLFVDYIINHLKPKGRAGIIVPEGIIFQSGKAYKELRKNLVENGLYAVVSLPGGVFQPYSGVKTSILLFNSELAKQKSDIAFVKITADGYDLGSSKREVSENDLPLALKSLKEYSHGKNSENAILTLVSKSKISESGEYNLSGDRYKNNIHERNSNWPMVRLGEVSEILNGFAFKSDLYTNKGIRIVRITNVQKGFMKDDEPKFYPFSKSEEIKNYMLYENDVLVSLTGNVGRVAILPTSLMPAALNQRVACLRINDLNVIHKKYLFHILHAGSFEKESIRASSGVAQKNLSTEWLKKYEIPLPPLQIQEQLIAELDGYQGVINGAKQIIENWRPRIQIEDAWELRSVDEMVDLGRGRVISKQDLENNPGPYPVYSSQTSNEGIFGYLGSYDFDGEFVTWTTDGAYAGTVFYRNGKFNCTNVCGTLQRKPNLESKLDMRYLAQILGQLTKPHVVQVGNPKLMNANVARIEIPVPPIEVQRELMEEIESEYQQVTSAKNLIEIYETRIQNVVDKLWSQ
jgi:type I restriction enzyme M protein